MKDSGVCGWLAINKPSGVTSTDVVRVARKRFATRRVGHAGTLDPAATGVLLLALGVATKLIPWVMDFDKVYRFRVSFGAETDTDDASGKVVARADSRPSTNELVGAMAELVGDVLQIPPRYSALKIGGQRAYNLARAGIEFELASRPQKIHRLQLVHRLSPDHGEFEVECNKGTYVRSLARDLGRKLGCLGHADRIERLRIGCVELGECIDFDLLCRPEGSADNYEDLLMPPESLLKSIHEYRCSPAELKRVQCGNPIRCEAEGFAAGETVWLSNAGQAQAMAIYRPPFLAPKRVLNR